MRGRGSIADSENAVLHFPVLRQGFIVGSVTRYSRETAEEIARQIAVATPAFIASTVTALHGSALGHIDSSQADDAAAHESSLRSVGTMVVDFPAISASIGDTQVEIRSCVTVCVENHQSKIWTRVNACDSNSRIPDDQTDALFDRFENAARAINEALMAQYSSVLAEFASLRTPLAKTYELNVRTVSREEPEIDRYVTEVFRHGNYDSVDEETRNLVTQSIRSIDSRFSEVPTPTPITLVTEDGPAKRRQIGFVGLRMPNSEEAGFSLHQVNVVYALEYGRNRADLSGVGYDPYLEMANSRSSLSHVASANVAVEYGSIF